MVPRPNIKSARIEDEDLAVILEVVYKALS
jgi:hypothetical protein